MKALVIVAHDFHLGYLGCYGNGWIATPHLDRLAAEGIVFDQHYADGPHGLWSGHFQFPDPLARPEREQGKQPSLALGASCFPNARLIEPGRLPSKKADPLKRCIQQALKELDNLAEEPAWLLGVELPSLCPPWRIPEKFLAAYFDSEESEEEDDDHEPLTPWLDPPLGPVDSANAAVWDRLQYTYAAAVSHLDEQVGLLLDHLRQRFTEDDVLICFTASRGLALGEHGILGPMRPWLYDELIHLPLVLRLPRGAQSGRRVAALSQPVDLLPTLLDAFALPIPPLHGYSLLPLAKGQAKRVRSYACSGLQVDDEVEWALRTSEWAFLLPLRSAADEEPRKPQLYVKPDDRWEVNNVVHHHLERAERIEKTLRDFVAATFLPGPLQPPELG